MKINLNGQSRELDSSTTLEELIGQFCKNTKHVIAELNGEIIKAQKWTETQVKDGDHVELVNFVGGG